MNHGWTQTAEMDRETWGALCGDVRRLVELHGWGGSGESIWMIVHEDSFSVQYRDLDGERGEETFAITRPLRREGRTTICATKTGGMLDELGCAILLAAADRDAGFEIESDVDPGRDLYERLRDEDG